MPRALAVGHTDGHGAVATAISIQNLEKEAYDVDYIAKFPETGLIPKFWSETIREIKTAYELIVLVDIPFDRNNFEGSKEELKRLARRTRVIYIDHHPLPGPVEDLKDLCRVELKPSAYSTVYGKPDDFWCVVGAICDRDPKEIEGSLNLKLMEVADGVDVGVRKGLNETIEKIRQNDREYFLNLGKEIPEPPEFEVYGKIVWVKGPIKEGWKFKSLDKVLRKTGSTFAVYLSERVPDRATQEPRDFLSVVKYWLSSSPYTAKQLLPAELRDRAIGHPNAVSVSLPPGKGRPYLEKILSYRME